MKGVQSFRSPSSRVIYFNTLVTRSAVDSKVNSTSSSREIYRGRQIELTNGRKSDFLQRSTRLLSRYQPPPSLQQRDGLGAVLG